LRGATLPAMSEALGLAGLLAECGKPYVLSFIIRPDGTLLDGNALDRVVHTIDDSVGTPPVFYALNCVHPSIVISALEQLPATVTERLWGLLANAAALSPEQLDCATTMIADEPEPFAAKMLDLKMRYGMKILGGCCGTDQRHIQAIVDACA
jgi:homocysteine S-methyltransferase